MSNNFVSNILFLGGIGITIYAIRSYGHQKEVQGYIQGCKAMLEIKDGIKSGAEKDEIIKQFYPKM